MASPDWLQNLAAIGDAAAGAATVAAVFIGWRQLQAWQGQRSAEARSEPAGLALVAIHDACSLVHNWCTIMQIAEAGTPVHGEESGGASDGAAWGRREARHVAAALERAEVQAYVHLDEPERKLVWEAKGLLIQAGMEADHLEGTIKRVAAERVHAVFSGLVRDADALRKRADAVLRPIARFGRKEGAE